MLIELIGYFAAFLTTAAFVPQAYKISKEKSSEGVSLTMYLVMLTGVFLWLLYGLLISRWPVILANSVTASLLLYIIYIKVKYKN